MTSKARIRTILPVDASRYSIAVVTAQFNEDITEQLRAGAVACLAIHGIAPDRIALFDCPGAFELPQAANVIAKRLKPDAIICLGAVIRGETPHFDYVAGETARGIQQVALAHSLPVVFGVLTTDTRRQALERVGGRHGHKGWDAALTAIQMTDLFRTIKRRPK